ncbi:MAG: sulfatase [Armatimonadota bacterium]|nr:MAG: sulfatase [Armatimonadota bacterium]
MPGNARRWNLLILCPDQLRADYLGCYGHPRIGTCRLDALAAEGALLERAYCAAPLCGPSRISFVTSTRLSEHNHRNYGSTVDFGVPNLVRSLKEAGYRTAMFGKNHCFEQDQLPEIWDELDEICQGNYDSHPLYRRSFEAFPMDPDSSFASDARITQDAVEFISRQRGGEPWLCWVNWQSPHPAFTCPEPFFSMFRPDEMILPEGYRNPASAKPRRVLNWRIASQAQDASDEDIRRAIAAYMGQVRWVDQLAGQILDALSESGQDGSTLVAFFADHGELLGDQGCFHKIPVFYECLTRIPVILRHPEGAYRGRFRGLVEEVDLAPTLLEACGIPIPLAFTGKSLHDRLVSRRLDDSEGRPSALVEAGIKAPTWPEPWPEPQKAPFPPHSFGPGAMITDGRYKLSLYHDDTPELYDLQTDPKELNNRFEDPLLKDVRDRLTLELCRRLLGAGVRDAKVICWPEGADPRDTPMETTVLRERLRRLEEQGDAR